MAHKIRGGLLERRSEFQGGGNREFTIIRKYFVTFGSLTISMLLNVVFGCGFRIGISVKYLKCNENMLDMKIQKYFKRRKIVLIPQTKLMCER